MPILFYPQDGDLANSPIPAKLEVLLEAAERYKAAILDTAPKPIVAPTGENHKKISIPREITNVFNWEEMAKLLKEIRELPEGNTATKLSKADRLAKLAEIYEVLRGAKMPKLEAVRLALMNEANQLRSGSGASQVA